MHELWDYEKIVLQNGLRVLMHQDMRSAISSINIMYNVGSRDESPIKTGLAHLFEHLMFGGSENVPVYDKALQRVGGQNNAYTSTDVTNYYCTLPTSNLSTACWLESDRMCSPNLDKQTLEIQQKVVIEEFKEHYLNQPYGNMWLKLCETAYTHHPYQWPTIGRHIDHIKSICLEDVKDFFHKFYAPNNAVLVISGNVDIEYTNLMATRWFGDILDHAVPNRLLPVEPPQISARHVDMQAKVPMDAIYKAYHMPGRLSEDYMVSQVLVELLGGSRSARLYKQLVDKYSYLSHVNTYTTESIDPGLLIISGSLNPKITFDAVEQSITETLLSVQQDIAVQEIEKVKCQLLTHEASESTSLLYRSQELAIATLLGDTNLPIYFSKQLQAVQVKDVQRVAEQILRPENCTTIHYHKLS